MVEEYPRIKQLGMTVIEDPVQHVTWTDLDEKVIDGGLDRERFIQAAISALGSRGLVDQDEAERRAAICAACPLNTTVGGCWRCKGLADWLFKLIGARNTAHAGRLNQCGVCGCSIKAKIWLPLDVAQGVSEGYKFPSWCWLNGNDPE